jgi:hypothetical protein
VEPILTKLQPVEKPIEPESEIILQPSSPLPKKKRSKTKIQRAPSLMEQMTKRQVATISKSKSAKSKRKESLRSEEEQRLTLDDFLAQSKENIHVPETPQKNIGFFDSPSEFKSPTKRRYAKPEFTTPTKKSKFSNVILQTPE